MARLSAIRPDRETENPSDLKKEKRNVNENSVYGINDFEARTHTFLRLSKKGISDKFSVHKNAPKGSRNGDSIFQFPFFKDQDWRKTSLSSFVHSYLSKYPFDIQRV